MPLIPRLTSLWRNLLQKDRVEQEFTEEIQAYLEMLTEAKILEGLKPQEARREALIEMGGVEQVKERVREIRMGYFLETMWQDLRYGMRVLVKSPVFTTVAVLSLALGIGANTAIFSVVNGLLLRPLPYPDSQRIVHVWHTPPQESFPGMNRFSVSPANYLDWKDQNHTFEQMAAYGYAGFSLSASDDPVAVTGAAVSSEFFSVLRSNASQGRTFLPEEEQPGRDQAVVISHGLWQRAFGANPNLIGQTLTLNSRSFTVIGIMPAGFEFPREAELWVPLAWDDNERQTRSIHDYVVIARLNPNVSLAQAQAEMSTISSRLEQQYPEENKRWGAVVIPLQEDLIGDIRPALLVLFCAVGFVLLIACANVANLMLARGASRQKEIAIRIALGAPRARIVRQLLSESVLLAVVGGLLGLLLAGWGSELLVQLSSDTLPNPGEIGIDKWALGFTLLVSLAAGIAAGIAPAFQFATADTSETLKQGTGRTGGSSAKQRTRKALVICEVALSLILLIGAGLMIRSLMTPSFHLQQGPREVIGVVGDVKGQGLDAETASTMYLSYKQAPRPYMTFVARTASDPQNFIQAISKTVYSVDKEQALTNIGTMEQVLAASLSGRRFNMTLLITFAVLALVLAAVGVYGVMNYSVTLRRRELGIRMALGARAADVLRLVLGQGLTLTLIGIGAGLVGAYGLTRLMESLLYGVTATDFLTFVTVSGVLMAVGLLASYVPARRATKVDPMIALRQE
jgi:ABC-type antimicrobial peptide transport system permease subunit